MNLTVNQTITIYQLRVGSVTNSSVLQIGTAGIIKPLSNLYNTGEFTAPAPMAGGGVPVSKVPGIVVPLPSVSK